MRQIPVTETATVSGSSHRLYLRLHAGFQRGLNSILRTELRPDRPVSTLLPSQKQRIADGDALDDGRPHPTVKTTVARNARRGMRVTSHPCQPVRDLVFYGPDFSKEPTAFRFARLSGEPHAAGRCQAPAMRGRTRCPLPTGMSLHCLPFA